MLPNRIGELTEFRFGKIAARIARIGFQEFDRHLALRARPLQMRGLAADIADQTCKTAAQSRTRFVGHRQLPWIHATTPNWTPIFFLGRRVGKAKRAHQHIAAEMVGTAKTPLPTLRKSSQCVRSSRSRWITSVASFR